MSRDEPGGLDFVFRKELQKSANADCTSEQSFGSFS